MLLERSRHLARRAICASLAALALSSAAALAGTDWWSPTGPAGGDILALAIDPISPNVVYAGAAGGIFKTLDGASRWQPAAGGLPSAPALALAIDPKTTFTVYAGIKNHGVYKSVNGGANWSLASSGLSATNVFALAVDPGTPSILYAGTDSGVFKSVDGAATWSSASAGIGAQPVFALAVDPAAPAMLYAGTKKAGVFRSADGAGSWQPAAAGLPQIPVFALAIDPTTPSNLYAGTANGVFKSASAGTSWTATNVGFGINFALALDPASPGTIYAGQAPLDVVELTGGGSDWSEADGGLPHVACIAANCYVDALVIDTRTPTTLYAGTQDGMFKSVDGGHTWAPANTGLVAFKVFGLAVDPVASSTVFAGTDEGAFRSQDGGVSWTRLSGGVSEKGVFAFAVLSGASSTVVAGTDDGVWRSVDGGATWKQVQLTGSIVALVPSPISPNTLFEGGQGGVGVSLDGGATWGGFATAVTPLPPVNAVALDPTNADTVYAGTDGGVYKTIKSPSGKLKWQTNGALASRRVFALALQPGAASTVYAGTDGGLFKSVDGGVSWTPLGNGMTAAEIFTLAFSGGSFYAATNGGVFVSADSGASWSAINDGLTTRVVNALAIAPGASPVLYAGTNGHSVFQLGEARSCTADSETMCLNGGRFMVRVGWHAGNLGTSGAGEAVALTSDTGYFWFFQSSNVELVLKVLDARALDQHFWVFYGALSNVEYRITVRDTTTGEFRIYENPQNSMASVADTAAFPVTTDVSADSAEAEEVQEAVQREQNGLDGIVRGLSSRAEATAATCAPTPTSLCLSGGRFRVEVSWAARHLGTSGVGQAVPLTADTGYFWFFQSTNVELILKVLDARSFSGHFWVFYGALSNVEYTIKVTDTVTGAVKTYFNAQDHLASNADTAAF